MAWRNTTKNLIVYVGERRNNPAIAALKSAGFSVSSLHTLDHGVAFCVHNPVRLAILDQELFVEVDGWSPAQSFKLVKPELRVVVMTGAQKFGDGLPEGVDALVENKSSRMLVKEAKRLLAQT